MDADIQQFLAAPAFAVAGASSNRAKYGNMVLRCYQLNNKLVYPIHPSEAQIEGLTCYRSVLDLPVSVSSISIITPPSITEQVVEQALAHGIKNIWMQPGAESASAIAKCRQAGINLIADGRCILVELGFSH